ncbi:MAG: hypothetical protein L0206_08495, partial [Actinobacteria bacterium]|nr:hypothetical protein [Actinomycetota bacterium]
RDGIVIQFRDPEDGGSERVELVFEGASPEVGVEGLDQEPGLHHAYIGNDPAKWVRNVRTFERVRMVGLYEGIDVVLREEGGRLEYDVHVAPEADLSQVVVRVAGGGPLRIADDGCLVLETAMGPIWHSTSESWQEGKEGRKFLDVGYRLLGEDHFGFLALERDPFLPLVIDPELLWSTYWGGVPVTYYTAADIAEDAVVDPQGNVTIVGTVEGGQWLAELTPAAFQAPKVAADVFVAKFEQASGKLIYSTQIGSSASDLGKGVAVDATGRATVVGTAGQNADDFPTTPGSFDPTKSVLDNDVAFVLRLSPDGSELEYSTYLEGIGGSYGNAVAVASSGAAIAAGVAGSKDFPTTAGAYNTTGAVFVDAFVTRLDPTGSYLEWSTFLGGNGWDEPFKLALDADENVFAVGYTASSTFPTTPGSFQPQGTVPSWGYEAFVTQLAADGASLVWSTYLGGSDTELAYGVGLAADGDILVTGLTRSLNFPVTPGAFQKELGQGGGAYWQDGFLTRIDASGSSLVFSTYFGEPSSPYDTGYGVVVDASGVATLVGGGIVQTTPGAFPGMFGTFVSRFHPDGSRLFYSTQFGTSYNIDYARTAAASPAGLLTIGGQTFGAHPTTENATFPNPIGGGFDAYITTFIPLLDGVEVQGTASSSCLGPLQINATSQPLAGQPFSVYCSQATPDAKGVLLVRQGDGAAQVIQVQSDASGFVETSLGSLPPAGTKLRCRYRFRNTMACPGTTPVSSSSLLLVTVQ